MFKTACLSIAILFSTLALPQDAEAGPLMDWWRGLRQRRVCNTCTPRTVANYTPAQANSMGLQPGQCARTCMKTCSRTVVNYVPQTCYRTAWNRVPVTQYRPVTNSDPCTGCTVTCMRPCTTYTWQMRRVPYTTYRPVYRQESYKVPVTTITNDCATGNCGTCPTGTCGVADGCSTCGVPTTTMGSPTMANPTPATSTNGVYYTDPAGNRLDTSGGFQVPEVPADSSPSLVDPQQTQAPSVLQRMQETATSWPQAPSSVPSNTVRPVNTRSQNNWQDQPQPARIEMDNLTAEKSSPLRERWSYSPVRLASFSKPVQPEAKTAQEFETVSGELTLVKQATPEPRKQKHSNSGWSTVQW